MIFLFSLSMIEFHKCEYYIEYYTERLSYVSKYRLLSNVSYTNIVAQLGVDDNNSRGSFRKVLWLNRLFRRGGGSTTIHQLTLNTAAVTGCKND
jgi:hypothetical protein